MGQSLLFATYRLLLWHLYKDWCVSEAYYSLHAPIFVCWQSYFVIARSSSNYLTDTQFLFPQQEAYREAYLSWQPLRRGIEGVSILRLLIVGAVGIHINLAVQRISVVVTM